MKLVYIAGPYRGKDYLEIDSNIDRVRRAAARLAKEGIAFIAPHLNTAHFEVITPDIPEQWWLDMTMGLLHRCDAIYVLVGSERSKGTQAEILDAQAREVPLFWQEEFHLLKRWYFEEAL